MQSVLAVVCKRDCDGCIHTALRSAVWRANGVKTGKMDGRTRKRSGISEALSACMWQEACAMIKRLLRQRKVFIKVNEYYCGR